MLQSKSHRTMEKVVAEAVELVLSSGNHVY